MRECSESELAFDDDPSIRWLFWMAHPDDEFFIGAWIRRLTRAGCDVAIGWTHHTEVRRGEALAAAACLGARPDRLFFLGGGDGSVAEEMPDLIDPLREVVRAVAPHRVVTTAFEQGHLDHDATNRMVNAAFDGPIYEIPLYHPYTRRIQRLARFGDGGPSDRLVLTEEEVAFKRKLLRHYPSQRIGRIVAWAERWERIAYREIEIGRLERMRLQTHRDWRRPNLREPFAREVARSPRWRRWLAALDRFESGLKNGVLRDRI